MRRFLYSLHEFFKRLRPHTTAMVILMTLAMFIWIQNIGYIRYIMYDYRIVKSSESNVYYTEAFVSDEDLSKLIQGQPTAMTLKVDEIAKMPEVDHVYCVYTANSVSYHDSGFSILLLDPKITEDFTALKETGFDFEGNEEGCIVVGPYFDDLSHEIELKFNRPGIHTETFPVIKHIRSAYKQLLLSGTSTDHLAQDLFQSVDAAIIMPATKKNLEHFREVSLLISSPNYIISFNKSASNDDIAGVKRAFAPFGQMVSMEEITNNTEVQIKENMKTMLPRPAFLLLTSTVSYLSMVILFVRKKSDELAVSYLCGASKSQTIRLTLAATTVVSLIPAIINLIIIGIADSSRTNAALDDGFLGIRFSSMMLGDTARLMVLAYFAFTLIIAFVTVLAMTAGKSPIMLLRRNE